MKMAQKEINKKETTFIILGFVGLLLCIIILFSRNKSNTEKVHILKEFNSTGQLIGTNEYVIRSGDTIMHGKFVNYNENGNKVQEGQFVNGHIYGKGTNYYENGRVECSYYKKNSKITLEAFWNYPNGKIERYTLYEDFGNPVFIIKYDKRGVVDSYKGSPQIETYQYKYANKEQFKIEENQYLKVGDKLKYSYIVANIANAKRSFKIENLNIDNSKVKRTLKHIPPTQIDVEEVLTKKGKNIIRSIVKYDFNDKVTPALIDTISFDVDVH